MRHKGKGSSKAAKPTSEEQPGLLDDEDEDEESDGHAALLAAWTTEVVATARTRLRPRVERAKYTLSDDETLSETGTPGKRKRASNSQQNTPSEGKPGKLSQTPTPVTPMHACMF